MHVKFIARGTGSANAASDYLLGERDAAGQLRTGVEVLRGDPEQVAAVADSLEFEHKYRSAVITWSPEDRPTDAQIEAVLDEFEKTAWAGLDADRYSWAAVLHREQGGRVHVHVLTARCDLETGKSLNIAPPGKLDRTTRGWHGHQIAEAGRDANPFCPSATIRRLACVPGIDWCTVRHGAVADRSP